MDTHTSATHATGAGTPRNKLVRSLARHLFRNELDEVGDLIAAAAPGDDLLRLVGFLQRMGAQEKQLSLLLRVLLSDNAVTFRHLGLIGLALEVGAAIGRQELVTERIARLIKANQGSIVHWGYSDRLFRFKLLGLEVTKQLAVLKYGGIPAFDSDALFELDSAELFAIADKYAERLLLPQSLLDNLYRHSRCRGYQRADWERHVKAAYFVDHLTEDLDRALRGGARRNRTSADLVDAETKKHLHDQIAISNGTILMSFHGGFMSLARVLYTVTFESGVAIQAYRRPGQGRIGVRDDRRAALFAAFRALQDCKALFIAADGAYGDKLSSINVLGVPVDVGLGAAFLAYETKCNTAWYAVERRDGRFVPVIISGPSRSAGETYDEFQRRLLSFAAERIESLVTGDPRNIALGHKWTVTLGGSSPEADEPS